MDILDRIKDWFNSLKRVKYTSKFLQYHHIGICNKPCEDCSYRDRRIYENGNHVELPAHILCDCKYTEVKEQPAGYISKKGITAPDVYLKAFGKLPDYYITKDEAKSKYGWSPGKDLSMLAPGKMIGGDIYRNNLHILPEKMVEFGMSAMLITKPDQEIVCVYIILTTD